VPTVNQATSPSSSIVTTKPTAAQPTSTTTNAPVPSLAASTSFGAQTSPCTYGLFDGQAALPDPRCTPGTVNPAVSQSTITTTICAAGYSASVRPPESVTHPEKIAAMEAYGRSDPTSGYEYDHLVSLELGGSPNAAGNLWPEPLLGPFGARVKDVLENKLHQMVCAGALPLATAQQEEASNWIAAYNRYVGPLG
jgi:hypothetical protein